MYVTMYKFLHEQHPDVFCEPTNVLVLLIQEEVGYCGIRVHDH